ncbi:MAG: excinuclease ABC subunit UvrC [Nitrospirae bacterium]|nr:excinuclease ABC subunit UvrC [Nitrospirota bacterium]
MNPDIAELPKRPGVYIFKGSKENVIYVGKAKNLKNRLASYFQKSSGLDARKQKMVRLIRGFSYIVTGNELEALILEANLIKQHKPRFNIILRDDKNYPCLKLTVKEQWPRLEVVRRVKNDSNVYFGPYVPAQAMWEALAVIRKHFRIRTCKYPLDRPMRPCIQYQMKRCPAPCAGLIDREEYMKTVEDVRLFLLGEKTALIDRLQKHMLKLSDEMRFEEAAKERDRLLMLQRAFESQKVISPELGDIDVIGYCSGDDTQNTGEDTPTISPFAFHILFIRNGIMIGAKDFFIENPLADSEESMLHGFIEAFYSKDMTPPPVILTNKTPHGIKTLQEWLGAKRSGKARIKVPARGKKHELLIMANENAKLHMSSPKYFDKGNVMAEVGSKLNLEEAPHSIGAFDISTIQGSDSVGAYVCWEGEDFNKNRYRHIRIKNVEGVDDYAMMREAVERVFGSSRNDASIPDLVLIDGGAGQLSAAREILEGLGINTGLAGIAKKPDRAFLLSGKVIDIGDRSDSSLLLRKIRDEVHRFAVGFHRKSRDKRTLESPLEKIEGIGKQRRLSLLRHFGSLEGIRNASVEEIAALKGFNKELAEKVKQGVFDLKLIPDRKIPETF